MSEKLNRTNLDNWNNDWNIWLKTENSDNRIFSVWRKYVHKICILVICNVLVLKTWLRQQLLYWTNITIQNISRKLYAKIYVKNYWNILRYCINKQKWLHWWLQKLQTILKSFPILQKEDGGAWWWQKARYLQSIGFTIPWIRGYNINITPKQKSQIMKIYDESEMPFSGYMSRLK